MNKYFIYQPSVQGSVEEEWIQCLEQISDTIKKGYRAVRLNVFIGNTEDSKYPNLKQQVLHSVADLFGENSPAVAVTVHPPEDPWKVAVEALFLVAGGRNAVTKYYGELPYVVILSQWGKEIWCSGLGTDRFQGDTRKAASSAFEQMAEILANEDMSMDNIIRQWNFIGKILEFRDGLQNYQVFNEVRSEYYGRYRTLPFFPAATGIGMGSGGVIIDFCAVKADNTVLIRGLSNPEQVNAWEYDQEVLKGLTDSGKIKKQAPQFERALLHSAPSGSVLFVSGTASIKGQETMGIGDVGKQCLVTIDNINKLADAARIADITGKGKPSEMVYRLLRVFIKNREDFGKVRSICNEQFPSVPSVFVSADVCRDDLLTEIEAEVSVRY